MSDTSTTIVPELTNYPDSDIKAKAVVDWLISIKAIKSIKTDCILSSTNLGYPIDSGAKALTDEPEYLPFPLITNGLEITTKRTVFDAGENGLDSFTCPQCSEDIISQEWDFNDFIEKGDTILICPVCNQASDLNEYIIEPTWGFSNLGFTFWNWPPLKNNIIKEFEERLNCKVKIIYCHI